MGENSDLTNAAFRVPRRVIFYDAVLHCFKAVVTITRPRLAASAKRVPSLRVSSNGAARDSAKHFGERFLHALLARIVHQPIVTRSVSEGRLTSSPRLRFGLR